MNARIIEAKCILYPPSKNSAASRSVNNQEDDEDDSGSPKEPKLRRKSPGGGTHHAKVLRHLHIDMLSQSMPGSREDRRLRAQRQQQQQQLESARRAKDREGARSATPGVDGGDVLKTTTSRPGSANSRAGSRPPSALGERTTAKHHSDRDRLQQQDLAHDKLPAFRILCIGQYRDYEPLTPEIAELVKPRLDYLDTLVRNKRKRTKPVLKSALNQV